MQTTRNNMNVASAAPAPSLSSSYSLQQQQQAQQGSSSSSSSASSQQQSLTVYQITAVAYVYQRIARVLYLGPMTIVGMYLCTATSLLVLDQMTRGLAHVAIVMTIVLIFSGFQTIRLLASSTTNISSSSLSNKQPGSSSSSSVDRALRANESRLPVLSLMLSIAAARFVVHPMLQFFDLGNNSNVVSSTTSLSSIFFTWTSLKSLFRITCIVALLTISVFARYIGPQSIMRLSCAPLAVNYAEYWIRTMLSSASLVGDAPGQLLATPSFSKDHYQGRRFQRPTLLATVSQFIIGLVIGGAVAYLIDLDWFQQRSWHHHHHHHHHHGGRDNSHNMHHYDNDGDNYSRSRELFFAVLAASLLTTTSHYHLHNISHELSPFRYTMPFDLLDHVFGQRRLLLLRSLVKDLVYSISISVISMVGSVYFSSLLYTKSSSTMATGRVESNNSMTMSLFLMCSLSVGMMLIQFCLSSVDTSIKYALFCSSSTSAGTSRQAAVEDAIVLMSQDSQSEYLNTVLASLLMDNLSLMTGVVEAASELEQQQLHAYSVDDFGAQYMQKMVQLVKAMGNVLILQPGVVEAFLEEDVFRFAILESLGGHTRQNGVIVEWASKGSYRVRPVGGKGGGHEPLIVVLVRGLCVFLGGMCLAIGVCFDKPQKNMRSTAIESFELPAGVFACTGFALTALARCFVECFEERYTTPAKNSVPGPPSSSWKSDHLKILIPIALNILYDLRCQIVRVDVATGGESDNSSTTARPLYRNQPRPQHASAGGDSSIDTTANSDLKQLLAACEEAATTILHATTALRRNSSSSSSSSSPTTAMEFDHHAHSMPLLHPDAGRWLMDCNDSSFSSGIKLD